MKNVEIQGRRLLLLAVAGLYLLLSSPAVYAAGDTPELKVQEHTLSNGMKLLLLPRPGGEPTVADSPTPLAPIGWCGDGVTVKPVSQSGTSSEVGIR